uniref:Uncharacterized protein n=1 Tax=Haptolina ericina TaxID=156174 RepID=A0A7S3AIG7_9EUKA
MATKLGAVREVLAIEVAPAPTARSSEPLSLCQESRKVGRIGLSRRVSFDVKDEPTTTVMNCAGRRIGRQLRDMIRDRKVDVERKGANRKELLDASWQRVPQPGSIWERGEANPSSHRIGRAL